jgi:hypothetical protein
VTKRGRVVDASDSLATGTNKSNIAKIVATSKKRV